MGVLSAVKNYAGQGAYFFYVPLDRRVVLDYNIFVKRCRGSGVWKYGKDDIL